MKCIRCGHSKSKEEFYKNRFVKSGFFSKCIDCHKEYTKKRAAVIKKYIDNIKSKPCNDCGVKYPPYVMDFHHTGDDKIYTIAAMGTYSIEKIDKEIAKCDLLCANCHRIRHYKEGV